MLTLTFSTPPWPENRGGGNFHKQCRQTNAGERAREREKKAQCTDDTVGFCGRVSLPDDEFLKSFQESS